MTFTDMAYMATLMSNIKNLAINPPIMARTTACGFLLANPLPEIKMPKNVAKAIKIFPPITKFRSTPLAVSALLKTTATPFTTIKMQIIGR